MITRMWPCLYSTMATLLEKMDHANESKRLFTQAAAIFRRALGADHPHTKMNEGKAAAQT